MATRADVRKQVHEELSASADGALISDEWIGQEVDRRMNPAKKNKRTETDWEKELTSDEIITHDDGKQVVILKALQRLAREADIVKSYPSSVGHAVAPDGTGLIHCIYLTEWPDGAIIGGAADCNRGNTSEDFRVYPTAVAESRAETRALRKALGISMLGAEEIDMSEGFTGKTSIDTGKIDPQQVVAIEKLLAEVKVEPIDLFKAVASDREVLDVNELTSAEAVAAMGYLNDRRGQPSKRSARKESLESELEGKS